MTSTLASTNFAVGKFSEGQFGISYPKDLPFEVQYPYSEISDLISLLSSINGDGTYTSSYFIAHVGERMFNIGILGGGVGYGIKAPTQYLSELASLLTSFESAWTGYTPYDVPLLPSIVPSGSGAPTEATPGPFYLQTS